MATKANGEARRTNEATENQDSDQAQVDIWRYVFGFTEMAVVKCAIELGIADFLESNKEPVSLNQLSAALGCCSSSLYRILRFLINRGIFEETSNRNGEISYVQTPLSRLIRRESGNSMAAFVLFESSPVMLAPWHNLSARILLSKDENNNNSAFDAAHGKDVWEYAESNAGHNKLLNNAMACDAKVAISAIVSGCPEILKGLNSLVDVGGGDGTALRMLVDAFPWITGINFDLPHVASFAPHSDGVQHVGGDMFSYVPKADAAFLMWVLHDWGDEECIRILKKCGEAIPKDTGKLIIVEAVIGEGEGGRGNDKLKDVGLMLDMVMMAHTSHGKERTAKEWAYVLSEAGFNTHTINHINAVQSVIQAYP